MATATRNPPMVLTKAEGKRLVNQPNRRYPTGQRNYAILLLMLRAGLRVCEVLKLEPHHIDSDNLKIFIEKSKRGKNRYIDVEPFVIDAIDKWMLYRYGKPKPGTRSPKNPTKAIFCTLQRSTLNSRYIREMVKREAKAARIDKDIHPHTLRHSYATHLLDEGFNIREVQEALGHKYLDTTMIYTQVSRNEFAQKVRNRSF